MKIFIFLSFSILFLISTKATAQKTTYYHHENIDMVFIKSDSPALFGNNSSLQDYMYNHLNEIISKTDGIIEIGVVIDTLGRTYCRAIKNNSNLNIDRVGLVTVIESLPPWTPVYQNGHKVNCAVKVSLQFNQDKLVASYKMGHLY